MNNKCITNELETKSIISHSKTKLKDNNKKLMKIIAFNKLNYSDWILEVIECTDNHKFFVEELNDYIEAETGEVNYFDDWYNITDLIKMGLLVDNSDDTWSIMIN